MRAYLRSGTSFTLHWLFISSLALVVWWYCRSYHSVDGSCIITRERQGSGGCQFSKEIGVLGLHFSLYPIIWSFPVQYSSVFQSCIVVIILKYNHTKPKNQKVDSKTRNLGDGVCEKSSSTQWHGWSSVYNAYRTKQTASW